MKANQVYELVNSVVAQAIGTEELTATDTTSLVAMGTTILSSTDYLDNFIQTLVDRIGKTIISYRKYTNKMADMLLDDFQFGAIVQKIKVSMPIVEEDQTLLPENGGTVDHYTVAKPKASQTFFANESPYQIKVTIQKKWLKEAFLSVTAMGGFISAIFGEVQNKLDLTLEVLGRTCITNYISKIAKTDRVINLVTEYNAIQGTTLTAAEAYFNEPFLRYAITRIKEVSSDLTEMSRYFNDGTEDRHTPFSKQKLKVLSKFEKYLETSVQYAAFNDKYVKLNGFQEINFWQSLGEKGIDRAKININGVELDNIVAVIHDVDSLGIYRKQEETATTPLNAAGLYYNTFWHENQLWFNDLSENFVVFTLN